MVKKVANTSNQETVVGLELYSEGDLTLSVRNLRTLRSYLSKVTVALVVVGPLELRSVKGVEVVHRENRCDTFSDEEVFLGVQVLDVERRVSHPAVVSLSVSEYKLARCKSERIGIIHLGCRDLADEEVSCL